MRKLGDVIIREKMAQEAVKFARKHSQDMKTMWGKGTYRPDMAEFKSHKGVLNK